MHTSIIENLPNEPIYLNKEEIDSPNEIIEYFFSAYTFQEIRTLLYNSLEVALTTENSSFAEAQEREWLWLFNGDLQRFIEAVYFSEKKLATNRKMAKKSLLKRRVQHH